MSQPQQRDPNEVFTPKTVVSREMFTRRNEANLELGDVGLQDSLGDAIGEAGAQILIWGDPGVGKTSLLQYAAEDVGADYVSVRCSSKRSFDSHIEEALRKLIDFQEVEYIETTDTAIGGEAGVDKVITIKGNLKRGKTGQSRFEAIQKPPLEALMQARQDNAVKVVAFDNFQNVDDAERRHFAEAIERLSDEAGD